MSTLNRLGGLRMTERLLDTSSAVGDIEASI